MAFFTKRCHPPGTLIEARTPDTAPLRFRLIDCCRGAVAVDAYIEAVECAPYPQRESVTWVHVQWRPTGASLQELGSAFGLHRLAVADVLNTRPRPTIEPFDDQLFVVMSMPLMLHDRVSSEPVAFFLNETFLFGFNEGAFTPFGAVLKRSRDEGSRLRTRRVDFLLHSQIDIDIVIDQGFPLLEDFGLRLQGLEERIPTAAEQGTLGKRHVVKRELPFLGDALTAYPARRAVLG